MSCQDVICLHQPFSSQHCYVIPVVHAHCCAKPCCTCPSWYADRRVCEVQQMWKHDTDSRVNTREPRDKAAENLGVSATCCQHHVPVWVQLPGLRRERENEIMRETHAEEVREREWLSSPHRLPVDRLFCRWTLPSFGFGWWLLVATCCLSGCFCFVFFCFFFKDRRSSSVDCCCSSAGLLENSQMRSCQKSDRQRKILLVRGRPHTDLVPS